METFSSRTEKVLCNLKKTSAIYHFCLFLIKTPALQDGELIFSYLKTKMLCSIMLHIKHTGSESCIIYMFYYLFYI